MRFTRQSGRAKRAVVVAVAILLVIHTNGISSEQDKKAKYTVPTYDETYQLMVHAWTNANNVNAPLEDSLIDTLILFDSNGHPKTVHVFHEIMIESGITDPNQSYLLNRVHTHGNLSLAVGNFSARPGTGGPLNTGYFMEKGVLQIGPDGKTDSTETIVYDGPDYWYADLSFRGEEAEQIQSVLKKDCGFSIGGIRVIGENWFVVGLRETPERIEARIKTADFITKNMKAFSDFYYYLLVASSDKKIVLGHSIFIAGQISDYLIHYYPIKDSTENLRQANIIGASFCFGLPEMSIATDSSEHAVKQFLQHNLVTITKHAITGTTSPYFHIEPLALIEQH